MCLVSEDIPCDKSSDARDTENNRLDGQVIRTEYKVRVIQIILMTNINFLRFLK